MTVIISGATNKFDYDKYDDYYDEIKTAVGEISDNDDSTIGGVINSLNNDIRNDLEYAEVSAWASSKLEAWDEMYPSLVTSYNNLVELLDAAKYASLSYQKFDENNQGINN